MLLHHRHSKAPECIQVGVLLSESTSSTYRHRIPAAFSKSNWAGDHVAGRARLLAGQGDGFPYPGEGQVRPDAQLRLQPPPARPGSRRAVRQHNATQHRTQLAEQASVFRSTILALNKLLIRLSSISRGLFTPGSDPDPDIT